MARGKQRKKDARMEPHSRRKKYDERHRHRLLPLPSLVLLKYAKDRVSHTDRRDERRSSVEDRCDEEGSDTEDADEQMPKPGRADSDSHSLDSAALSIIYHCCGWREKGHKARDWWW